MRTQLRTAALGSTDEKTSLPYLTTLNETPLTAEPDSSLKAENPFAGNAWKASRSQTLDSQKSVRETEASYPRDSPGEEASELARVWRIYLDEASRYDLSLTEGCNRGIDVLLVFTGLFSAVLTTFIVQSLGILIPDSGETTNALLEQLIAIQKNTTFVAQPSSTPTSPSQMRWVVGLWLAALSCSLSTALVSMLAKQWLQAYVPTTSGSPRQRARQRHSRYTQLVSWHVLPLINAMPLLLHLALLLFFAGILVFLWTVDLAITIATFLVVTAAYAFYFASIWLSVLYPDCPYQHPISNHLHQWIQPLRIRSPYSSTFLDSSSLANSEEAPRPIWQVPTPDDKLDAEALVWLFAQSMDKHVTATALQAIAGLPRDFSAIGILRNAGALHLVEEGFRSCFDEDTAIDLKWHLSDVEGALLYCKAWINLTRGTSAELPGELRQPLTVLRTLVSHPDGAAIATCAAAVSSVDSHETQWELLGYLSRYLSGKVQLSDSTITWLLDCLIENLVQWVMATAVIEETRMRAVPVLLRILRVTEGMPTSNVRSATGLALRILTCGPVDLNHYRSETTRRLNHCEDLIMALSAIAAQPERFGVDEDLLNILTKELAKLAPPVVSQSYRFSSYSTEYVRSSLLHLFKAGRLGIGTVPDDVLADVLHLLNPLQIPQDHRPALIELLVDILWASSHPRITGFSVLLLKSLLSECSAAAAETFVEGNGLNTILRVAKSGDIDNRWLQVNSWRALCHFVDSSIVLCQQPSCEQLLDSLFHSDLFETICAVIASRRSWLLAVSSNWTSTLLTLCRLRPHETVWRTLIMIIHDTNAKYGEDNEMLPFAEKLKKIVRQHSRTQDVQGDVDNYDTRSVRTVMTMEAQRVAVRLSSSHFSIIRDDAYDGIAWD